MSKKLWLVIDPGSKNFALNMIRDHSLWMGYHPWAPHFGINDIKFFDSFKRTSEILVKRCDVVLIERFINRQANAKVSPEKLNLMIGTIICIARDLEKEVYAKTASAWKSQIAYDELQDYANQIGYARKHKHFVDTLLMWSVLTGNNRLSTLKNSLPAYFKWGEKHEKKNNRRTGS